MAALWKSRGLCRYGTLAATKALSVRGKFRDCSATPGNSFLDRAGFVAVHMATRFSVLIVTSLGLALTARYRIDWKPAKKPASFGDYRQTLPDR